MNVVHLMASPFVGGPERVVLGLARALPAAYRTAFLSFAERGLARPFLAKAAETGFEAVELRYNVPRFLRAAREVADHLRRLRADVLCCNGYKPDIIGWLAARRAGVPVVAIAHGWTAATWRVRLNEWLDRRVMRRLDAVVAVSSAQAERVRRAGVHADKVVVIHNAIETSRFDNPDPAARQELLSFFPEPPDRVVAAAGRLSPEKGFDLLIDAATAVTRQDPRTGFIVFGAGPLRTDLERRVKARGLGGRFIFAGFRNDFDRFLPWCDLVVSSSHTEGLPINVLEAQAAGLAVVATAVGGTPEIVKNQLTGSLVPPGNAAALAESIADLLRDREKRHKMGKTGKENVLAHFSYYSQTSQYAELFDRLTVGRRAKHLVSPPGPEPPTRASPP